MVVYDVDLQYHPGSINVVPDALSRKLEALLTQQPTQLLRKMVQLDLIVQKIGAPRQLMAF